MATFVYCVKWKKYCLNNNSINKKICWQICHHYYYKLYTCGNPTRDFVNNRCFQMFAHFLSCKVWHSDTWMWNLWSLCNWLCSSSLAFIRDYVNTYVAEYEHLFRHPSVIAKLSKYTDLLAVNVPSNTWIFPDYWRRFVWKDLWLFSNLILTCHFVVGFVIIQ